MVAENIHKARERQPRQETASLKLQVNDLVLVKDPESAAFNPKYMPNYRVTAVHGRNRIEVQDEKGNKSVRRAAHVKICEPVEKVITQLPPQKVYEEYGRASKLLIHPKDVPEVPLQLFTGQQQEKKPEETKLGNDMISNVIDEAESRAAVSGEEKGQYVNGNNPVVHSGCIDESNNRNQEVMQTESQLEQCEVNTLTIDWIHKAVTCDAPRLRLHMPMTQTTRETDRSFMQHDVWETNSDVNSRVELETKPVGIGSDNSDKSSSRIYPVSVGGDDSDESSRRTRKPVWLDDNVSDGSRSRVCCVRRGARCSRPGEKADANIASDESSSRGTRCPMSNPQQPEQPVTPVIQSGCIEPIRVNIHDIDECLVTNKCEHSKQDSKQMSKQWLSNTFSMITSGILGRSKIKTGVEVMENVDTVSKTKLVFKPEFHFDL